MNYALWLQLTAPELTLGVSALVLLLISAWGGERSTQGVGFLAVAALLVAGFLNWRFMIAPEYIQGSEAFYGQYLTDSFSALAKLMIYAAAIVSILVAPSWFGRSGPLRPEYPVLIIFATIGMGLMVSANDLLTLYVGLELSSLSAYVLASFARNDERSAEAGLKYFVLGGLASGILLFGMSLVYGFTAQTGFDEIRTVLDSGMTGGAMVGIVFMLAGLAFKISAVPFHMWTPDVYEGAPTPVTTFFASAPKVAAIALTMRVVLEAFGGQPGVWQQIVIVIALASIVWGAAGAIGQNSIKRLLAYSSINNVGFILIGLACATPEGASAMITYMIIYIMMSLGSFVCVLDMQDHEGKPVERLDQLAGLSQSRPGIAAAMAILMFSLAGIPPLFGFWGKFLVFDAAVAANMLPLAAIGIAASVIGAFYYIKVVKVIYFDDPANVVAPGNSALNNVIIAVLAVCLSPLGYLITPGLSPISDAAAQVLF